MAACNFHLFCRVFSNFGCLSERKFLSFFPASWLKRAVLLGRSVKGQFKNNYWVSEQFAVLPNRECLFSPFPECASIKKCEGSVLLVTPWICPVKC